MKINLHFRFTSIFFACLLAFMGVFTISVSALADTGYDDTAPVMNDLVIAGANDVHADAGLEVTFDLKEDGVGITYIQLDFVNEDTGQETAVNYDASDYSKPVLDPLYSGITTVILPFDNSVFEGKYELKCISMLDANGNQTYYSDVDNADSWNMFTSKEITVTQTPYTDQTAPLLSDLKIKNSDNVDSSGSVLHTTVKTQEDGVGISDITLTFEDEKGTVFYAEWGAGSVTPNGRELYSGTYDIDFHLQDNYYPGKYKLTEVDLMDFNGNYKAYTTDSPGWSSLAQEMTVTKAKYDTNEPAPVLDSISLSDTKLVTPAVFSLPLTITTGKYGVDWVSVTFQSDTGKSTPMMTTDLDDVIYSGTQTLRMTIDPFWSQNGDYHVYKITLHSPDGKTTTYDKDALAGIEGFQNPTITVSSAFDITYYGATANVSAAVDAINAMDEGQTAVLDYRNNPTASAKIFKAIAGLNKTVVFEGNDVQWVFNGKDIDPNNCKDINVHVFVGKESGASVGYPDDSEVLCMGFADNGKLPGKVEMRINNEYLKEKYRASSDMILSYYSGYSSDVLDTDVKCADDGYAEYEITHNSSYVLSDHNPRLLAPKGVTAVSKYLSYVKLTWKCVAGAQGYNIYRSSSKTGSYKKVAQVTGNRTLKWKDSSVAEGKTYFYKIIAYAAEKNTKAKYSSAVQCRVAPTKVTGVKAVAKKGNSVSISWNKPVSATGYDVYEQKNGKWLKIKRISHYDRNCYTVKVSGKGTYKFKIRAYEQRSRKTVYGSYSDPISIK